MATVIYHGTNSTGMREPSVAGQFYPGDRDELIKAIESAFSHELGPGVIPDLGNAGNLKGAVVPHAGYMFSGPVAAHVYSELRASGKPEVVVILGPNHTGWGADVALSTEDWVTPMGTVRIHTEAAEKLIEEGIPEDRAAHISEHSIEVQLPFLQYIFGDFRFIPICMLDQSIKTAEMVAEKIRDALSGISYVVLASSDFSHYVPMKEAEKRDAMAIECILSMDHRCLYDTIMKHRITMCGYGPVAACMLSVSATHGKLLRYATSGHVMSMRDVVGYGAIGFY